MRRVLEEFPEALKAVRGALADDLEALDAGLRSVRRRLDAIDDRAGSEAPDRRRP